MEQRLSREANISSANEEIPRNFRNPNVHYGTHKRPSPIPVVSQISTRLCILLLEDPLLILSSHLSLGIQIGPFLSSIPTKPLYGLPNVRDVPQDRSQPTALS